MKLFPLIAIAAGASVGLVVFLSSNNSNNNDASSPSASDRRRLKGLSFDPRTTVLKVRQQLQGDSLPKCPLRTDLSSFGTDQVGKKYHEVPKTLEGSNCLLFDCNQDVTECDNGDATDYNGDKPPCCTHVLRDMLRIFDEEMCALGLDYYAAFGTLLGLRRADRFIPWSADGDMMLYSDEAMNALVMLWDSQKTGMSHHFSQINRMCITAEFANGGLKKWAYDEERYRQAIDGWDKEFNLGFPYLDLYLGQVVEGNKLLVWSRCKHYLKDVFPTERKLVYGGQFAMNFPPNPDQILRTNYGNGWRFPPSEEEKAKHGDQLCPHGPGYEEVVA
eukprot:CAMPEP_0201739026 /NCGR_PEP_ID=MMETSP0593-20130828/45557_1 /ASSEMBLY_ACC=CAM_ASM_000672 /TAXON_ID=267983 /ORGANISM="Skeletonema japonicum, Strain CCMP2506" /LENGTH=331 /DNA_ID=CAMNT_0048233263 /DNA_START=61 /DNA_END=1056 /DNA_ORIENTATION=-